MRWHALLSLLKWPVTLAALACLFGLAHLAHEEAREERAREARAEKGEADEDEGRKEAREGVVKLTAEQVEKAGLKDGPARKVTWRERVVAYGRVVPNPRATGEVRAAFAGTLRAGADAWQGLLGKRVRAGHVLGWVDVRVGPQERLDLQSKLREARLREQGAEKVLKIKQERADRLDMAGGGVSRAELDAARVQLAEARTQLAVAQAAVNEWQGALAAIDGQAAKDSTWRQPLKAPTTGEVTELAARPDVALQAGDLVARVVDFRRPLVRLDLPPDVLAAGTPPALYLIAATASLAGEGTGGPAHPGGADRAMHATPVGPAPQVDAASQLLGYWYEVVPAKGKAGAAVPAPPAGWRPGLFVKAYLPLPGASPRAAVAVPLTALLYHQEHAVVFVRAAPGAYERRQVRLLGREGNDWLLAEGVRPGERVVSGRAGVLLSQATLAKQPGGEDND
jgi:cobalt-zinc-cadmium efflux system membrane fusion protein